MFAPSEGVLAQLTDIETGLEREPDFFRTLVENSEDLIVVLDREARLVYLSPATERILGYTIPEALGGPVWECVHPDDLAATSAAFQNVLAEQRTGQPVELRVRHLDGSWRHFAARASVMADVGHGGHLVVNGHDITARKSAEAQQRRMEEALVRGQKLESLGVLAEGVAHDFNNILGAIMGHTALAVAKLPEDSPARRNLAAVLEASERAAALSRKMLAFSGRGSFDIGRLELRDFLSDNRTLFGTGLSKDILVEVLTGDEPALVEADAGQLRQALVSLVMNAAEAIGRHPGTIRVSTMPRELGASGDELVDAAGTRLLPGRYVGIAVEDDGSGIEPAILNRIFEPFFGTKVSGRGLGLSAVLGIVRGHRGGIAVSSTPGRGSRFELLLPAAAPADAASPAPGPGGRGVLVVEDERTLRDVVLETLNAEGIRAWGARDAVEALQLLDQIRGDVAVVMLDLKTQGAGGAEALRALRSRGVAVKVLLTSGHAEPALVPFLEEVRPDAYLQKPYRTRALLEALRSLLAAPDAPPPS